MKYFILLSLFLASCSALPSSGPTALEIEQTQVEEKPPYRILEMRETTARLLHDLKPLSLHQYFGNAAPPPKQKIGIGDTLSITIYESASGGLFSAPVGTNILNGAKSVALPAQTVDRDGKISIPYAGRVQAHGRTPAQLAAKAEELLKSRAIEPQVVVTLVTNASMTATVLGDIVTGGKVPLNLRGERVLDVIASAGGVKAAEHQILIRLSRGKKTLTMPLSMLLKNPQENIFIHPNDTVFLVKEEQYFYAFGAVGKQGQFTIDQAGLHLSDALGKAGGLIDTQADKGSIYLFRHETNALLASLEGFFADLPLEKGKETPVIYKINFSDPQSLFFLTQIPLRARDLLYVSTAPSVEMGKLLSLIGTSLGTVRASTSLSNSLIP